MPEIQWDEYWANAPRSAVITLAYAIPEVGSLISKAIDMFWPEAKADMNALIAASEARMKQWMQAQLADYDRKQLADELQGFRENLKAYADETSQRQRQSFMNSLIVTANQLKTHFLDPQSTVNPADYLNSLTLIREFAVSHMLLLRERVVFTKEIFGDDVVPIDKYTQEFTDAVATYQAYIEKAVAEIMKWRQDQITVKQVSGSQGQLTDNARGVSGQWVDVGLAAQYNAFLLNQAQVELTRNYLDVASAWSLLIPNGKEVHPIPADRQIVIGLFGVAMWDIGRNDWFGGFVNGLAELDPPGRITKIVVKEDTALSFIFFEYDGGRRGKRLGHPLGGIYHQVVVPDGVSIKQVDTYWMVSCRGIQFHFTDGTSSDLIGQKIGVFQSAQYPDHILRSVALYGNPTACLGEIYFLFQPDPATFK